MFDLVLKDGVVIDGSGKEPFPGYVAIKNGEIAAIGQGATTGDWPSIDCKGQFITPGFIDVHSHCDLVSFMSDSFLKNSRVMQGVTTELIGQCGLGPVPYDPKTMEPWRDYLKAIIGDPEIDWSWRDFAGFGKAVAETIKAHHVAGLVTHGAIRAKVLGLDNVKATPEQLGEMEELLAHALEQGAFGMSVGLAYLPGVFAPKEELLALCKVVAKYDGVVMVHIRNHSLFVVQAMEEMLDLAEKSGVKMHISHMRSYANRKYGITGAELLTMIEDARVKGIDVSFDQHPYTAGSTLLSQILPPWAKEGGTTDIIARLKEPAVIAQLKEDYQEGARPYEGWDNYVNICGWDNLMISAVKKEENQIYQGKSLQEVSQMMGMDVVEAAANFIIKDDGESCMVVHKMFSEEDIAELLAHPLSQIGSDGIPTGNPHPRLYGTFPKFFGTYVRDKKIMSWQEGVKRVTSDSAKRLGMKGKGLIREGYDADLVVFAPEEIQDEENYMNSAIQPKGISHVLVDGRVVLEDGKTKNPGSGKFIFKV
jgi:N-acyl-D-amino-acid deacylase